MLPRSFLLASAISLCVTAFTANADASFWYRHKIPGVVATDAAAPNHQPTLAGIPSAITVQTDATSMPFAGATVDDIDDDALTTTVLIEDPDVGLFATSGGFTDQGGGSYAFAGTADATTVAMRGLTFEPADGRLSPGESETVVINISVIDALGAAASAAAALTIRSPEPEIPNALYAWGNNGFGKLGLGHQTTMYTPEKVASSVTWKSVSAGSDYTVGLKFDGTMWAWGRGANGTLGLGGTSDMKIPTELAVGGPWAAVSAGNSHNLAIAADGSLWGWGYNADGRVGDGSQTSRLVPTRIGTDSDWVSAVAGGTHSMAIKSDGSLWSWGDNEYGQLGHGDRDDRSVPIEVHEHGGWTQVSAGYEHTVGIKSDGTMWSWGNHTFTRLGTGSTVAVDELDPVQIGGTSDWRMVAAGYKNNAAIKSDGSLWTWGNNESLQLGKGSTGSVRTPTQIGADSWRMVAATNAHVLAIKSDGTLWSWGTSHGSLGLGTSITNTATPMQIGSSSAWRSVSAGWGSSFGIQDE